MRTICGSRYWVTSIGFCALMWEAQSFFITLSG
jgi:hypothetical protein